MSLPPNANIQALLGQLLAATQGQAPPRTATSGPVDIVSTMAALAMLAPQLTAALQTPTSSNEADESSMDRLSDSNRRINMKFKYNERPSGTAGRGDFDLRNRMGLNKLDYDLFLRTVKDATHVAQLDRTQMMKFQDARRLARARSKIIKALPGLSVYANCKWPYWPVDGGLLISLKASAQAHKRRQEQLALEENPPANVGDDPADDGHDPMNADDHPNADDPANVRDDHVLDAAPAGNVEDDSDTDEIGDQTMTSVHEFDEIPGAEVDTEEEESEDEQEEEVMDDTPPSAPPAYNSAPAPVRLDTDSSLAPSTTRKAGSRKTSPLPPALVANTPAAKDRAQSLAPTDPDPLDSGTTTTRSRRNNKAAGSVSISPASNIVLTSTTGAAPATSTISYAATTTTTVQAQASSTTGAPHELGDPAGYAWLPVSKRPPIPSVQDPVVPNPADSTAKPKRGKKAATVAPPANVDAPAAASEAAQSKPKPKGRTAKAGAAVPAPDPEVSDIEAAPVAKATRKRAGAGASANKSANAKPASGSRPRSK
ncbi:hypothetical protein RhiJN_19890 [Ceratobasidium sp. AG-Ba]|nr:hypothetical protein RhiJN_19890 [Ceratobasidium sp. AG-Ba]